MKNVIIMKLKTIALILLTGISVHLMIAQDHYKPIRQDKVLFIELENEKFEIENRNFYISKVIDERKDKSIIGISQKGAFNKKINTKFTDGVEISVFNFISNSLPKEEGQKEIVVKIIELQISEVTVWNETGKATIKMDFYSYNDAGHFVKVFQTGAVIAESSIDVTKRHEARIRQTIINCMEKFSFSTWIENLSSQFSENKKMEVSLPDNLVEGIYKNFQEFLSNKPRITKGYYVKSKPRTHKKWNETVSFTLKDSTSKRKIEKIWGFSDGESAYILHQKEFFKIELVENRYQFVGFDKINLDTSYAPAYFGGLIGASATSSIALRQAKNRPTEYFIDIYTGMPINLEEEKIKFLGKMVKLYFYRLGKKEDIAPVLLSVNDSLHFNFVPNSFEVLSFRSSESPVKVCYGSGLQTCLAIELDKEEDTYVKYSNLITDDQSSLEKVKNSKGEFDIVTPKRVQRKRDKLALRNQTLK